MSGVELLECQPDRPRPAAADTGELVAQVLVRLRSDGREEYRLRSLLNRYVLLHGALRCGGGGGDSGTRHFWRKELNATESRLRAYAAAGVLPAPK